MKKCYKCEQVKSYDEFYKNNSRSDGVSSECISCYKVYESKNRERRKLRSKTWEEKNKDKRSQQKTQWFINNALKEKNRKANWYHNNKERSKNNHLNRMYGITLDEYNIKLSEQNNQCAICNNISKRSLHVDHCHKTGQIRGLLCLACNTLIGYSKENIDSLKNAINYLIKHKGNKHGTMETTRN